MNTTRRLLVGLAAISLCALSLASNPVGHWRGKIHLDASKMPKSSQMDAEQQKKFMAQMKTMMEKMVIELNLKKDHTFIVHVTGAPNQAGSQDQHGTWSQKGDTLTLTGSKDTSHGKGSQNFHISHNGKILTLDSKEGPGSLTFTRA